MYKIILSDRYDTINTIREEKILWTNNSLLMFGVIKNDIESEDPENLKKYGIEVWDHLDNGDLEIIRANILIAKWYHPKLLPKYDKNNKIYYEIHLDYDSILDNEFYSPGGKK